MDPDLYSNFKWLVSESAREKISAAQQLFDEKINPLRIARALRKQMEPDRAALVMEQAQLRIRARKKFPHAEQMFFSGRSLEQSSGQLMGDYKAQRFADCQRVVDVCCGIGGDLLSLAKQVPAVCGIDMDPVTILFATENAKVLGRENVEFHCGDFESADVAPYQGLHFDPDRRANGRTVSPHHFQPSLTDIFDRVDPSRQQIGIKIAPGSPMNELPDCPVEREWIGDSRECKQQMLWMGPELKQHQIRATVVSKDGSVASFGRSLEFVDAVPPPDIPDVGSYIYEPHATVIAAGLVHAIAAEHQLQRLCPTVAYLGSDRILNDVFPLLRGYKVLKVLPIDMKRLAAELKARDVGKLVIKKRAIDQVVSKKVARLKLEGDQTGTVILTRHQRHRRAIIVDRLDR